MRARIKKNDTVMVIAGRERGERVRLGRAVLEGDALAEEARRGDLEGDGRREAGRGIRCADHGPGGCLVEIDRLGDELRGEADSG